MMLQMLNTPKIALSFGSSERKNGSVLLEEWGQEHTDLELLH